MEAETWKPIPGFDGYEISDLGNVRSLDRTRLLRNRWGDYRLRRYRGHVLKQSTNQNSYKCVKLGQHSEKHEVHRLVMIAFVGLPPPKHEVCHWDGDGGNNALGNLRYATKQINYLDSVRHGTAKICRRSAKASTTYCHP